MGRTVLIHDFVRKFPSLLGQNAKSMSEHFQLWNHVFQNVNFWLKNSEYFAIEVMNTFSRLFISP